MELMGFWAAVLKLGSKQPAIVCLSFPLVLAFYDEAFLNYDFYHFHEIWLWRLGKLFLVGRLPGKTPFISGRLRRLQSIMENATRDQSIEPLIHASRSLQTDRQPLVSLGSSLNQRPQQRRAHL